MAVFPVVLDASVLFNRPVTDTLLRAAEKGLYRVHWSDQILNETTGRLVKKKRCTEQQANNLRAALTSAFPEAMVNVPPDLVLKMTNDPKDRHVTAAAIVAQAQVIVTFNLPDFKKEDLEPWNLEAQHPDVNLVHLFDLWPSVLKEIINEQSMDLRGVSVSQLLTTLARDVPNFAERVRGV